jgi:hypothetical protein
MDWVITTQRDHPVLRNSHPGKPNYGAGLAAEAFNPNGLHSRRFPINEHERHWSVAGLDSNRDQQLVNGMAEFDRPFFTVDREFIATLSSSRFKVLHTGLRAALPERRSNRHVSGGNGLNERFPLRW